MRVQDVMSQKVSVVAPAAGAEAAWSQMRGQRIYHLVVRDGGQIVGVVSHRDLGGDRGGSLRKGKTVGDFMTRQVVSAGPTTTLRQAANLFRGHAIGCLPVVEGSKLVGIITVSDLLELLGRGVERPAPRTKRWTLKHRGRRPRAVSPGR